MKITVKDVAKRAGVSPATVSLVLNNRPGIGEPTATLVLEVAKELGYRKSQTQARKVGTNTIRFLHIAKHGHIVNRNHNVFISDYIKGLSHVANKNGFLLEVKDYSYFDKDEINRSIQNSSVSGVVILGTELNVADMKELKNLGIPTVVIDTYFSYSPFDCVDMNNEEAVFSVVSHFVKMGHTDIGIVKSSAKTRNFSIRQKSFTKAMSHFGLGIKPQNIFWVDSTYANAYQQMKKLLLNNPTLPSALFFVCDIIAYGCIRALKENGYRVPEDISVVGFDDLPASEMAEPPLTSIRVSKERIGRRAMQMLLRRLGSSENLPYEKTLIGSELVKRESVKKLNKNRK